MQSSSLICYTKCLLGIEVFSSPTWRTRYCSPISQKLTFSNEVCEKLSIPCDEIRLVRATAETGTNNSRVYLRGRRRGVTSLPGAAYLLLPLQATLSLRFAGTSKVAEPRHGAERVLWGGGSREESECPGRTRPAAVREEPPSST